MSLRHAPGPAATGVLAEVDRVARRFRHQLATRIPRAGEGRQHEPRHSRQRRRSGRALVSPTAEKPRKHLLVNGKIYLLIERDGDGLTLKWLALAGSTPMVCADNPAFPLSVDLEDAPLH